MCLNLALFDDTPQPAPHYHNGKVSKEEFLAHLRLADPVSAEQVEVMLNKKRSYLNSYPFQHNGQQYCYTLTAGGLWQRTSSPTTTQTTG